MQVVIRQFVRGDGTLEIESWYERQSKKVRARFDISLRYLAQRPREKWQRPDAAKLVKDGSGLYEIRFKENDVQYRPLGYFGPKNDDTEFTITMCNVIEKLDEFIPKDACRKALNRAKAVNNDPNRASTWTLK